MICPICELPSRDGEVHDECRTITCRKFYDIVAGNFRQEEIEIIQEELEGVWMNEWLDKQKEKWDGRKKAGVG